MNQSRAEVLTVLFNVSVERRSNWQGHQAPGRRNRNPYPPVVDAGPRGQPPVPSEPRHAVRTALCPAMSVAPAAVHNASSKTAELGGGTTIRYLRNCQLCDRTGRTIERCWLKARYQLK